jgi:hypothetical protein
MNFYSLHFPRSFVTAYLRKISAPAPVRIFFVLNQHTHLASNRRRNAHCSDKQPLPAEMKAIMHTYENCFFKRQAPVPGRMLYDHVPACIGG